VPALNAAPKGFMNSFYNNYRRVRGVSLQRAGAFLPDSLRSKLPETGLRGLAKREQEAVERINELNRSIAIARRQADEAGGGDDALRSQVSEMTAQVDELTAAVDKVRGRMDNLKNRRRLGDDGAFAGEQGDLIRLMSSADTTTKNFLESAWMRGNDQLLNANNWVKIQPGKPQYWQELSGAVRQFRNDDVAKRLLAGEDVGSVVAWMRSAQGRGYRRDMRIARDEVEGKVVEISDMIAAYLPTTAARAAAAKGEVSGSRLQQMLGHLAKKADDQQGPFLSPIHGREVALKTQGNPLVEAYRRPIQALFRVIGTYSESTLVRHPFYAEVWNRRVNALRQTARTQGRNVDAATPEGAKLMQQIDQAAHRYAMRATNETLYTIERYSNLANMFRWASPFFAAWENSFTVFARLIANDPSIAARANILWNIPNQLGLVVDRDGNKVEAKNWRFLTGESNQHYIMLPAGANEWVEKFSGGVPIKIPQGGVNVVTPGEYPYLPGFGPVVTIAAGKFLATKPDTQKFLRDNLGDALYEQVAPFGTVRDGLVDAAAPAWVRAAYRRWQGESDEHYLRTASAMMQNAMVEWYLSGGRPQDRPDMDVVMQRANDFYRFSMFAALVAPVSPNRISKYQTQIDYWNNLKTDGSMTYREKVEVFTRKFGDSYLPLITSTSKSDVTGVEPTIEAYNMLQDFDGLARELAQLDPDAVGILAASAPLGEFDPGVYKYLNENEIPGTSMTYRGARTPGEMQNAVILQKAWREYRQAKEARDAMLRNRGLSSIMQKDAEDIRLAWNKYTREDMVGRYGEQWAVAYSSFEQKSPTYLVGIQKAVNNKQFMDRVGNTPLWRNVNEYMSSRQRALSMIASGRSSSEVRNAWEQWVSDFKYSSLEFADFYDKFLDQDQLTEIGLSGLV
jgi:hypothetical protein